MQKPDSGRGEIYVLIQIVLLAGILLAPFALSSLALPESLRGIGIVAGLLIGVVGGLCCLFAALHLGPNLSIFPRPIDNGTLVQGGIYALVRHPMYTGVLSLSLAWSLLWGSLPGLALVIALVILFDRKAAREEQWLTEKFPDYPTYCQRVRKLIPWLY